MKRCGLIPVVHYFQSKIKTGAFSSWDSFGHVAEPWIGTGNDFKPQFKKAHDETHDVWSKTGNRGWWSIAYAMKGLYRVRKGSEEGKFDSRDGYNKLCQGKRYEFQIVKVTVSRKVEIAHLML